MKEEVKKNAFITVSIKIENNEVKQLLQSYMYFENNLLDLIIQNYNLYIEDKDTNDFELLTSPEVIINALYNNNSENSEQVKYLQNKYKNNIMWVTLKNIVQKLNPYNLVYVIKKVNSKLNIQKLERYKQNPIVLEEVPSLLKPSLLSPNDLSYVRNYYIELDKQNSFSFERLEKDNLIGISLSQKKKMMYINLNKKQREGLKKQIKEITDKDKIRSVKIIYNNGNLYLQGNGSLHLEIIYLKKISKTENEQINHEIKSVNNQCETEKEIVKHKVENKQIKYAGIDMGSTNLMAVFIDDDTTPSLIVDGTPFKHYNTKFNHLISKLKAEAIKNVVEYNTSKSGNKCTVKYAEKGESICNFISFLCSERNRFFTNQFNKLAKEVVEYLHLHGVTDLFLSKNLAVSKDDKECTLIKVVKQNYMQNTRHKHRHIPIPFAMLIKYIDHEAQEYGIRVQYIPEDYTSIVSCITGDIKSVQKNPKLTNAYNGKRGRVLFLDNVINERFNADLNAAVNHIKVGTGKSFEWLKDKLSKLRDYNKIEVNLDADLIDVISGICKAILV